MQRVLVPSIMWFIIGCGTDSPSPVEQCDDLVDVICDRAVSCLPSIGTHATCVQELQQEIPCGSVKRVSASYDRCMSQLRTSSCPVLFPPDTQTGSPMLELPADCMSVVLTRTDGSPLGAPATESRWLNAAGVAD